MIFLLNEASAENRFRAGNNFEFFRTLEVLKRDTEPQDYEDGNLHVFDSEGNEYNISYTDKPNSVEITRGAHQFDCVEGMVVELFRRIGMEYDGALSIEENIENANNRRRLSIIE